MSEYIELLDQTLTVLFKDWPLLLMGAIIGVAVIGDVSKWFVSEDNSQD